MTFHSFAKIFKTCAYTKSLYVSAIASGLGQMNFRKYVLAGKGHEVLRYIFFGIETAERKLSKISNETGVMYIEGYLLFNLAGYSSRNHACLPCMSCHVLQNKYNQ